ncbi:hypothetical protein OE749_15700 [Aestuariibacter sp. AA17]|uniref:Class IIb bacteriocin, lactobin A/cerein 7B family n=1 Tax=Fluctibacter corallii TaxID=2984329 RepID=A0ABT3ABS6_9ALTE|nr:hypothetical protein [Aestuariibacter sp. AA17]MCV2886137.1 hypothetical protein [Aestuariibacter sp. AA17]
MKTLSFDDIANINGGNLPMSIASGLTTAYLYDVVGGQEGINNYFSNS